MGFSLELMSGQMCVENSSYLWELGHWRRPAIVVVETNGEWRRGEAEDRGRARAASHLLLPLLNTEVTLDVSVTSRLDHLSLLTSAL